MHVVPGQSHAMMLYRGRKQWPAELQWPIRNTAGGGLLALSNGNIFARPSPRQALHMYHLAWLGIADHAI